MQALRHPILLIFSIELKDFGASLLDYRSFNSETSKLEFPTY